MEFGTFSAKKAKPKPKSSNPRHSRDSRARGARLDNTLNHEGVEEIMAGRPPKSARGGKPTERVLELSELDEAMALKCYPGDDPTAERRRERFLIFLRALRPSTAKPRTSTRAVHVYFYDEMLRELYEGWKELVSNHQIDRSDSMSKVVGKMVTEYTRLAKSLKEARRKHAEAAQQAENKAENRTGPTPHTAHTNDSEKAVAEPPPDRVSSPEDSSE